MQQYVRLAGSFILSLCISIFFALTFLGGRGAEAYLVNPTTSMDVINRTCERCSELSLTFNYAFCMASLSRIPVAHVTNIQGLAIISMELALQNATDTVSTIKALLEDKSLNPFAKVCLKDCLELYGGAIPTLVDTIGAFLLGQYESAGMWMTAVMDATGTCEDGFGEKEGEASPLTSENRNLFLLSDIALCIIRLLSLALPP